MSESGTAIQIDSSPISDILEAYSGRFISPHLAKEVLQKLFERYLENKFIKIENSYYSITKINFNIIDREIDGLCNLTLYYNNHYVHYINSIVKLDIKYIYNDLIFDLYSKIDLINNSDISEVEKILFVV